MLNHKKLLTYFQLDSANKLCSIVIYYFGFMQTFHSSELFINKRHVAILWFMAYWLNCEI